MIKTFLFIMFCSLILMLSLRGLPGNPVSETIDREKWSGDKSPFELSPERGRFSLTLSLVENKSFHFSVPLARFAVPDLAYKDGKYVSLFAPGVSFVIAPGYILGKQFNLGQMGAFATIAFFALLNALLIRAIAIYLKVSNLAAALGALAFLFATPAFVYAVSLFQHHISTFLILLSLYVVLRFNNFWSLSLVWFLIATAVPVDYPNIFLMLPIGIYSLIKLISIKKINSSTFVSIKLLRLLAFAAILLPMTFFLWFNQASYNNPFQLSGTIKSVKEIDQNGQPVSAEQLSKRVGRRYEVADLNRVKTVTGFFKTRNLLNGFYILFISPDRGLVWFAPIVLLSVFGAIYLYKRNSSITVVLLSIIGINVLLYSMWGDPWGGWAFGPRYLVPGFAICAVLLANTLMWFRTKISLLVIFTLILSYSIFVNELGAITTSTNPPKVEAVELSKLSGRKEHYTYQRNLNYLLKNNSKSFIWQTFGQKLTALQYFLIIYGLIVLPTGIMLMVLRKRNYA